MNQHSADERFTALAPIPERLDQEWANATLARILADEQTTRPRRRVSRPLAAVAVAGALTLSAGAAVAIAGDDPIHTVKDALLGFQDEPNTTGNDVGTIQDPQLVAQFTRSNGDVFAVWIAKTSSGAVCSASSGDGWDGVGSPSPDQLEYGCGGQIVDPADPSHRSIPLERPDQLGGYFKDFGGPIIYGVSPYADATSVRVQGQGIDRTLPVRADSLGYGTDLPGAHAASVTLTFLDSAGHVLGSKTVIAPVG